jgi:hypothetical protein
VDSRDSLASPARPADGTVIDGPSLFTAIQEQLGLHLRVQRVPLDVIVIDLVETPSENRTPSALLPAHTVILYLAHRPSWGSMPTIFHVGLRHFSA